MNLREIYIYTNRISKMEGLDTLVNVETLWLNDNKIRWVQRAACVIAVFFATVHHSLCAGTLKGCQSSRG